MPVANRQLQSSPPTVVFPPVSAHAAIRTRAAPFKPFSAACISAYNHYGQTCWARLPLDEMDLRHHHSSYLIQPCPSEAQFQRHLDDARDRRAGDAAEAAGGNGRLRVVEVRVVQAR